MPLQTQWSTTNILEVQSDSPHDRIPLECHLTDSGELPPIPHEIVKITHISKAEENTQGVNEDLTKSHREQYGVPDSENLLDAADVEERASQKRAVSSVSHASTSSRQANESPSKQQRTIL